MKNIKHKAILSTIYSAGLRISEVINLPIKAIDSDRMQIHIINAKGNKDRYEASGYTHITHTVWKKIKSPLDELDFEWLIKK